MFTILRDSPVWRTYPAAGQVRPVITLLHKLHSRCFCSTQSHISGAVLTMARSFHISKEQSCFSKTGISANRVKHGANPPRSSLMGTEYEPNNSHMICADTHIANA